MVQFTKAEEYGLLGILYLAGKEPNVITPLSEISQAQEIPEKFLAKIFQSLSRSGLVRSHRGVRGGFTLGRRPEEISIKEILESIQGPYHLLKCIPEPNLCTKSDPCALRDLLIIAEDKLVSVFAEHTLAHLAHEQTAETTTG
ncbi:MAG: Rrf2 family transcriptional regulator [Candidatus Zixiibacteriota bacterium]|nr:MAG: Rrf2 family transcriptional regulator [candidate division Zixibacteria bacterium]